MSNAVKVKEEGIPELLEAVKRGQVSVSAAADVATLPKAEQTQIGARGEREILEAAARLPQSEALFHGRQDCQGLRRCQ